MATLYNSGGLPLPDFIRPERLQELKNFHVYPDDVWVVTYPKCGTTWTQQIVKLIRNNGQQDDVKITLSLPWLERLETIDFDCVIQPRGFKTHMPYNRFPCGPPDKNLCKYIYVARNPKDVAVSLYYHTKAVFFPNIDKKTFWSKFVNGELEFGNFFDHVLSWWEHRDDKNVLFLKYEDMKKDLVECVSKIASFIEADISSDVITKIAHQTTFDNMKRNPLANSPYTQEETDRSEIDFMRKGIVGDWKNFLTAEQSSEIDALCVSRLTPAGLEFDFQ